MGLALLTMPQKPGLAAPTPPLGQALSHRTSTLSATGFRENGDESSVPMTTCDPSPTLNHGSRIDDVLRPPASKPATESITTDQDNTRRDELQEAEREIMRFLLG